jgi:tetratricopeptide (TPR) repeat protein
VQNVIVRQLAPQVDPEFFMENLNPDWEAQGLVARAYDEIDRKDEARAIWEKHIREGMKRLKASMPEEKLELTALSLHDACTAIEDTDLAIQVLQRGLQRAPQSYLIRHRLAWDLYTAERYEEAADHLKWCASRRPDDDALQEAAALVTKQSLKHARGESRSKSG